MQPGDLLFATWLKNDMIDVSREDRGKLSGQELRYMMVHVSKMSLKRYMWHDSE